MEVEKKHGGQIKFLWVQIVIYVVVSVWVSKETTGVVVPSVTEIL